MKKFALPLIVALGLSLAAGPGVWAQQQKEEPQAAKLYQQCQERFQKDPKNTAAKKLCDEGMKQYQEGKQEEGSK
jgi:predicted negative regulator of RcsB-dependent stress response